LGSIPAPALKKSEFRPISRYHFNLIAIEAFKYPCAQVLAGSNKHRGAAIWAKVTINFVGCEAKE
jgi:hypothetical protein